MSSATTIINLTYGAWTQVVTNNEVASVTPQVQSGKFLVRYAAAPPAAGVTVGHEYERTDEEPNLMVGGHQTLAGYMRPINPAANVDVLVTGF